MFQNHTKSLLYPQLQALKIARKQAKNERYAMIASASLLFLFMAYHVINFAFNQ